MHISRRFARRWPARMLSVRPGHLLALRGSRSLQEVPLISICRNNPSATTTGASESQCVLVWPDSTGAVAVCKPRGVGGSWGNTIRRRARPVRATVPGEWFAAYPVWPIGEASRAASGAGRGRRWEFALVGGRLRGAGGRHTRAVCCTPLGRRKSTVRESGSLDRRAEERRRRSHVTTHVYAVIRTRRWDAELRRWWSPRFSHPETLRQVSPILNLTLRVGVRLLPSRGHGTVRGVKWVCPHEARAHGGDAWR
jgi:hypothetical protein